MKFSKLSIVAVVAVVATVFLFAGNVLAEGKSPFGKFGAISMQQRIISTPPKITCEYKDKCGIDWCFCMGWGTKKAEECSVEYSLCTGSWNPPNVGGAGADTIYGGEAVADTKRSDGKRVVFTPPPTCEEKFKGDDCAIGYCNCMKEAADGLGRISKSASNLCTGEALICLQDESKANSSFILLPLQKDEKKPAGRTVFTPPPPQKTCEERYTDERDIKLCECLKAAEDGLGRVSQRAEIICRMNQNNEK